MATRGLLTPVQEEAPAVVAGRIGMSPRVVIRIGLRVAAALAVISGVTFAYFSWTPSSDSKGKSNGSSIAKNTPSKAATFDEHLAEFGNVLKVALGSSDTESSVSSSEESTSLDSSDYEFKPVDFSSFGSSL